MYFKLSKWQEKIKNSNLKTVTFSFALEKAHGISHGVIPSRIFPSTKYPLQDTLEPHPTHTFPIVRPFELSLQQTVNRWALQLSSGNGNTVGFLGVPRMLQNPGNQTFSSQGQTKNQTRIRGAGQDQMGQEVQAQDVRRESRVSEHRLRPQMVNPPRLSYCINRSSFNKINQVLSFIG